MFESDSFGSIKQYKNRIDLHRISACTCSDVIDNSHNSYCMLCVCVTKNFLMCVLRKVKAWVQCELLDSCITGKFLTEAVQTAKHNV